LLAAKATAGGAVTASTAIQGPALQHSGLPSQQSMRQQGVGTRQDLGLRRAEHQQRQREGGDDLAAHRRAIVRRLAGFPTPSPLA